MKSEHRFFGPVDIGGHLDHDTRQQIVDCIRSFPGRKIEISVREYKSKRSLAQNRYYFGVVVKLLGEHCGYDAEEMHETLAMRFLRIEDCPVTGAPRRKRTPKFNTQEFSDYVDACVRLGAELGVVIPDANQVAA